MSLDNPRRFIFSKWTLREGWDNPNIFQICKLRSSGSEISKLQEVGRGLRLPVNEYGNRVKDEQFYLNYFVDFTESRFVDDLVKEINDKSGAISIEKLETNISPLIKIILQKYPEQFNDEEQLLYNIIKSSPEIGIDEITNQSALTPGTIAGVLLNLEFYSLITNLPGKRYKLL